MAGGLLAAANRYCFGLAAGWHEVPKAMIPWAPKSISRNRRIETISQQHLSSNEGRGLCWLAPLPHLIRYIVRGSVLVPVLLLLVLHFLGSGKSVLVPVGLARSTRKTMIFWANT
jgi:hypothetical protein